MLCACIYVQATSTERDLHWNVHHMFKGPKGNYLVVKAYGWLPGGACIMVYEAMDGHLCMIIHIAICR